MAQLGQDWVVDTRPIVAVDLDDTLITSDGWKGVDVFGRPIAGAIDFTRQLAEMADILIFTFRTNPTAAAGLGPRVLYWKVANYLSQEDFCYHGIWMGIGKPAANWFIDDRAIQCTPASGVLYLPSRCQDSETCYGMILDLLRAKLSERVKSHVTSD